MPSWTSLHRKKLNDSTSTSAWFTTAAFFLSEVTRAKCDLNLSGIGKTTCNKRRVQLQNVIIKQNKTNIPNR